MQEPDEQLLLDFANHFLGYGPLSSRLWLIGPEAGGGKSRTELDARLKVWADRGRHETEDLHGFHADLGIDWTNRIQRTWGSLIRVILAGQDGKVAGRDSVLKFQREHLGGSTALLDLSQLSSPSMAIWELDDYGFSWLASREVYEQQILRRRCRLLRAKVEEYKPKIVLFYGLGHAYFWGQVAQADFSPTALSRVSIARRDETLFVMMPHPNAVRLSGKGACNNYFAEAGATLAKG